MLGSARSCLRAARGGQGTLQTLPLRTSLVSATKFVLLLFPLGIRCLMVCLRAGALLWQSGGLEVWLVLLTGFKTDTFLQRYFSVFV